MDISSASVKIDSEKCLKIWGNANWWFSSPDGCVPGRRGTQSPCSSCVSRLGGMPGLPRRTNDVACQHSLRCRFALGVYSHIHRFVNAHTIWAWKRDEPTCTPHALSSSQSRGKACGHKSETARPRLFKGWGIWRGGLSKRSV